MSTEIYVLPRRKRIALIAHDNKKPELLHWARRHLDALSRHVLYATGTTGAMLAAELGLEVHRFRSGPLGGDQQVGAAIAEGKIDLVIFFWDPLEPRPHDVDVKALLRIAVVYDIPTACNRASADFLISSPLIHETYAREAVSDAVPGAGGAASMEGVGSTVGAVSTGSGVSTRSAVSIGSAVSTGGVVSTGSVLSAGGTVFIGSSGSADSARSTADPEIPAAPIARQSLLWRDESLP